MLVEAFVAILIWILLTLGQDIRSGRLARGWTQEDLAWEVGVDVRTVQRWESGQMVPRSHHIAALTKLTILDESHVYSGNMNRNIAIDGQQRINVGAAFAHVSMPEYLLRKERED